MLKICHDILRSLDTCYVADPFNEWLFTNWLEESGQEGHIHIEERQTINTTSRLEPLPHVFCSEFEHSCWARGKIFVRYLISKDVAVMLVQVLNKNSQRTGWVANTRVTPSEIICVSGLYIVPDVSISCTQCHGKGGIWGKRVCMVCQSEHGGWWTGCSCVEKEPLKPQPNNEELLNPLTG